MFVPSRPLNFSMYGGHQPFPLFPLITHISRLLPTEDEEEEREGERVCKWGRDGNMGEEVLLSSDMWKSDVHAVQYTLFPCLGFLNLPRFPC